MPTPFSWQATSGGDFGTASNWTPVGVPGAADSALLAAYGGTITGTGTVATLTFAGASWTLIGQVSTSTATINASTVGLSGSGMLTVAGALSAGTTSGATGTVSVTGAAELLATTAGTTSSFGVGGGNTGVLTVATRGIAGFAGGLNFGANNGSGSATVDAGVLAVSGVFQLGTGTAGGTGSVNVLDGGELLLSGAADASSSYLQLGATPGTGGFIQVDGASSLLIVSSNSGSVGMSGIGGLSVSNGAQARFATSNNAINPALGIGTRSGGSGTVTVAGTGSTLAANGTLSVGIAGRGTFNLFAGATATSTSFTSVQAALAVAAGFGGSGTLTINGTGSQLTASGQAVIGGDNRGSGFSLGGTGTVSITGGGTLVTGTMTIEPGSTVTVDGASQEVIQGDLYALGSLANSGTLFVTGTLLGSGALQLGGGSTEIGGLANANIAFTAGNAALRVHALTGTSTVNGLQFGDLVDLAGIGAARLTGNTVLTTTGTLVLGAAPAGSQYALTDDGSGGTIVGIAADTVGVYRFFDTKYGTHFFSGSSSERDTILATRPDLVFEGVGLQSVDPVSTDPNSAPVYRFFDSVYGTHFFTASASERDTVIQTRPDLLYEGVGFLEHNQQQPGDTPVYRFFDTNYGTHFYTADAGERATVLATRPDLVDEGIGFYAPP